jgi:hypothetical protein
VPKQPSLSQTPPELAVQAMFDPATVTYGSGTKLVWKCAAQEHQWEATVNSRTGKGTTGCPVYSNRQVLAGFNDLETTHPDIAWESDFDPMTGIAGRHSKMPWKCAPPGHKWAAVIGNRTGGNKSGCPVCADAGSIPGDLVWLYLMRHPDVPSCREIFAKCSHFAPKRARNVKPPLRF